MVATSVRERESRKSNQQVACGGGGRKSKELTGKDGEEDDEINSNNLVDDDGRQHQVDLLWKDNPSSRQMSVDRWKQGWRLARWMQRAIPELRKAESEGQPICRTARRPDRATHGK